MRIQRTNSKNTDFQQLVKLLDIELAERDGEEHSFYAQYNGIDHLNHVIVGYKDETPICIGAIKSFEAEKMEVKRMYIVKDERGKGLASILLQELEQWAKELGYDYCILETGKKQPEAIQLYLKNHYQIIPNYGQYAGIENSVCFQKSINS